jgi:hypothetical protein
MGTRSGPNGPGDGAAVVAPATVDAGAPAAVVVAPPPEVVVVVPPPPPRLEQAATTSARAKNPAARAR